jgi:DNA-binding winged helix-turn-helix (wHTH) protein
MDLAVISFGPFVLDAGDRRLLRDGQPIEVSGRYFDALTLLAAESGRLVTKDRFMDEVWRGIPVTDEALTQCIRSLRRALDDDAAAPRYIETVPRHGYRFIAAVQAKPTEAQGASLPRAVPFAVMPLVRDVIAAALGGGIAGIVAGLLYLSAGLVTPAMGTASTLMVLVSINLLLGLVAGGAVGLGLTAMEATGRGAWRPILGAAVGGLVVGAIGRMVGNDLFELLFGQAPGAITGAGEGLLVGVAVGCGHVLARRAAGSRSWLQLSAGFVCGGLAGLAMAAAGGRLMAGSLAQLAARFPNSRLGMGSMLGAHGFAPWTLAVATALECALFAGGVVLAITVARRVRRA